MIPIRRLLQLSVLLLVLAALALRAVNAAERNNVTLIYFNGESLDNAARLAWETGTEDETAGFKLERATSATGPYFYLENIGIVPAMGNVTAGATYQVTDDTAVNDTTYWYRLVEILFDNSELILDTIQVAVGPTPTPEPIGGGGGDGTSTPIPTSTTAPTATAQATATSGLLSPTAQNTPGAAATTSPTPALSATASILPTNTAQATATRFNSLPPAPTPADTDALDTTNAVAQITPENGYPDPSATEAFGVPYPGPIATSSGVTNDDTNLGSNPIAPSLASTPGNGQRVVGGTAESGTAGAEETVDPGPGRLILWISFLAALLLFGGGVLAAILLTKRK
jgi:hypothetical protein